MSSGRRYYEEYSLEELVEKNNPISYYIKFCTPKHSIEEELKTKDDALRSKTWTEAYKTAAYYYDNPSLEDVRFMFSQFRFNFSDLLSETENPNELPDLRSRENLGKWICKKHNEFLKNKNSEVKVDCNMTKIFNEFGPKYDNVKAFLGERDFYI